MHKRFVEGRKQLQKRPHIDEMIRLWKVAKMDRFGHFARAISIQNGQKCLIFRALLQRVKNLKSLLCFYLIFLSENA